MRRHLPETGARSPAELPDRTPGYGNPSFRPIPLEPTNDPEGIAVTIRRRPGIIAALALILTMTGAEAFAGSGAAERRAERALLPSTTPRGGAGATSTYVASRPFSVDGSPYMWSFEVSRYRSAPGAAPDDPNLRVIAVRRATGANQPDQIHTWSFDLAAGSLQFNGELRQVSIDTGLIPGYGAIFMDLEDLGALTTSKDRCPKTGDILSHRASRKGVLRGSVTFLPGFSDPQVPDQVDISHVRATIQRTKYTGNDCTYPGSCSPGRTLSSFQSSPDGGYQLNAGEAPSYDGLVFQQLETIGVAEVFHTVFAFGDDDVVVTTPTSVEVMSDVARPFIAPGGSMQWTKGMKDVHQTARCRRVTWVLAMPTGSFDFKLDSGDETLTAPASAEFEVATRR
jgi:hypothetical protein